MPGGSRTYKSMMNSIVALFMYVINLILQFYSRKVFLEYLGTEILGLNSTASNILQLFNLAELGISNAIAFTLYKPLADNDHEKIREIVELQGKLYKIIATAIIIVAIIVMLFFPIIFSKMELPLWYAYASFGVLLLSSLLGYFVNYKQIVLSADLKDYKIQYSYKLSNFIKLITQIVVIRATDNPYIWWLIIEGCFAIISSGTLNYVTYRTYPFLKSKSNKTLKELNLRYKEIIIKTKQLFFHKISGVTTFQISPLVIYGIYNLNIVTDYYNYMLVVMGIISLAVAVFNSVGYGIGNLIASNTKEHILDVFYQLYSIRFALLSTFAFAVFMGYQSFISLWIGRQYLLSHNSVIIFTAILYFYLSRYILYDFINGYGFFEDIWSSIIEVLMNIAISIALGIVFGFNGVLIGVLLSIIAISVIWKPIFFFRIKLGMKLKTYYLQFAKYNAIGLFFIIAYSRLFSSVSLRMDSWLTFIPQTTAITALYFLTIVVVLYFTDKPFKLFMNRFRHKSNH